MSETAERGLRQRKLEIVSCPSCGRAQVDVYSLAEQVQAGLEGSFDAPTCVHNPGGRKHAGVFRDCQRTAPGLDKDLKPTRIALG